MPGLLTLKTDLKSLKYGQDQPGGGSSRQPYIQTDINTIDAPTPLIRADFPTFFGGSLPVNIDINLNRLRLTKFDDGLIRGGIIGATNAAVVDTLRIGKFFLDFPKGPLFIIKQVGLQLTNPRLEIPKNPINILAGAPSNVLSVGTNGLLQPTRIYNLGINTLLQVPLNAFGGHIVRHGLLPVQSDASKYEAIVTANNDNFSLNDPSKNNRLVSLSRKFQLGDRQVNRATTGTIFNIINQISSVVNTLTGTSIPQLNRPIDTVIDDYLGGPSSVYGIGRTLIKRSSTNTEDGFRINLANQFSRNFAGKTRDKNGSPGSIILKSTIDYGISTRTSSTLAEKSFSDLPNQLSSTYLLDYNISNNRNPPKTNSSNLLLNEDDLVKNGPSSYSGSQGVTGLNSLSLPNLVYTGSSTPSYTTIENTVNGLTSPNNVGIYATLISGQQNLERLPNSTYKPTYKNSYGDVVKVGLPWNEATREIRVGSGRKDSINLTPLFKSKTGTHSDTVTINGTTYNINDLAKFRIQALDTNKPELSTWMIFRAYLTDLSDDTNAEWQDIKYAGRGDKFYIYNGFTRKMSIGFKVAALSGQEMAPMYQKLNFLMSNLMPDYQNNLMRGPLVRMTVGNYIDGQLGILTSLNYKISNDTPWEIAINEPLPNGEQTYQVLPHIIEVSLGFTPIGSQKGPNNALQQKDAVTSHIAQNWNEKGYILGYTNSMIWNEENNAYL
jgi:hypothetical protein